MIPVFFGWPAPGARSAGADSPDCGEFLGTRTDLDSPEDENIDDLRLIERTQNGDPTAFDWLVLRYQELIAAQMRRFSRDPRVVEELTQNVFVSAFFSLKNYQPHGPFLNWLRTIASRTGYAHWREEYKKSKLIPIEDWDGAEHDVKDEERAQGQLDWLLTQLKPPERQVMCLLYLDNLSIVQTAEIMGWTVGMVKMRAHRARKKLQRIIAERGEQGFYGVDHG